MMLMWTLDQRPSLAAAPVSAVVVATCPHPSGETVPTVPVTSKIREFEPTRGGVVRWFFDAASYRSVAPAYAGGVRGVPPRGKPV